MEDGAAKHEGNGISASARGTLPEALCALFVFAGCTELALEVLCIEVQHRAELIEICACANDFQTSKKRDIIGESLTFRTLFFQLRSRELSEKGVEFPDVAHGYRM